MKQPVEFLIGPAGSGKTHTCLDQVQAALAAPEGPRLLWIAPKQSTFQLEREVLRRGVRGFTRLEVLPFDRVARRVLQDLGVPAREVLSEEGRLMVLHALLLEAAEGLKVFGPSARAPGFASQLSQVLRELRQGGIGIEQLRKRRSREGMTKVLAGKIEDLALLLERYEGWLAAQGLRDPDDLLGLAAETLGRARAQGKPTPMFGGLWLDGFAEMTVPELDLLATLLPGCDHATLAFCLDGVPGPATQGEAGRERRASGSASLWGVTAATYLRCEERVRALGLATSVRELPANGGAPRFRNAPALGRLAGSLAHRMGEGRGEGSVNLVECADPEAEALLAVRLINRHVRQEGGRYREVSVIVRRLEGYGDVVQRAFRRHGIPYFADRREPMGHHPVAELTRSALRMAARGWAHEDWIGALKSGLVIGNPGFVDSLENAGLAKGLRGDEWLRLEEYRARAGLSDGAVRELPGPVAAFDRFRQTVGARVSGAGLAGALRRLWSDLRVPETLERWQEEAGELPPEYRAIHHTAWEQIGAWCDALELAFGDTVLPVSEWSGVAEAGLCGLTLGIIPPALDQVLVGAIDRMRQPEVKLTIVLGLNEGVFPAAPASPLLLNQVERQALAGEGLQWGWTPVELAAREQYYAYIACTRPSQRLCLAWSRRGLEGKAQVRSSVAERVLRLLGLKPGVKAEAGDALAFDGRLKSFDGAPRPVEAVTLAELFECPGWDRAVAGAGVGGPRDSMTSVIEGVAGIRTALHPAGGETSRRLAAETVKSLHPDNVLVSSVSALETFAVCPFRHFAEHELRLKERDEFEADARGMGTLLHAILKAFHDRTITERRSWRAWLPGEAAALVGKLGQEQLAKPRFAPLVQDALAAWETQRQVGRLGVMVEQGIAWMQATYTFEPFRAELRFGFEEESELPAWVLPLGNGGKLRLRGSIDRVDVCRLPEGRVLLAVLDYKTTAEAPNGRELEHGFELQLLAYLGLVAQSVELQKLLAPGADPPPAVEPAGAFYVPLGPKVKSVDRATEEDKVRDNYLASLAFEGRGNKEHSAWLDTPVEGSERPPRQFKAAQLIEADAFGALVANTVEFLKRHAAAILEGQVGAEPIRHGPSKSACDNCPYRPVCRFEPLGGGFRNLPPATPKAAKAVKAAKPAKAGKP